MTRTTWKRCAGAVVACFAIGGAALGWRALAETPPRPGGAHEVVPEETVQGAVVAFLKNDPGDIDGFTLDSGREIHFPPHLGAKVTGAIKIGDAVTVRGRNESRPRGEKVFAALNIESGATSIKIDPPRPPHPGGPGPAGPGRGPAEREQEPPMDAAGVVQSLTTNPHGDVDGFTLEDGTVVKFPPHQGAELAKLAPVGAKVKVTGRRHETPAGEIHLHADRVTAEESGTSLERDEPAPPPHGPRAGGPEGPSPQYDEILHELREIRRLLEERRGG